MSTKRTIRLIAVMGNNLFLAVWITLLSGTACGQAGQSTADKPGDSYGKSNIADRTARVKSGEFTAADVEAIATARAVEALPALKDRFAGSEDAFAKQRIASALIRLGDKDETYWKFLVDQATQAIENNAPNFIETEENGKTSDSQPSKAFIDWAKAHDVDVSTALENEMSLYPGAVSAIGMTGDARGIPLLRRALRSSNFLIQSQAALGLATIGDNDSIPLIVEACKKAPADSAAQIAKSLVYFDDPQAQSAVDTYVPKELIKFYREARAAGETPYGERPPH